MTLTYFLEKIKNNENVSFDETISIITEHYHYEPTEFSNGLESNAFVNNAGSNEGSCKIFAFALIHQLDQLQTLCLFGDFYKIDVLEKPKDTGHQNIRNFMQDGWEGIKFVKPALNLKA